MEEQKSISPVADALAALYDETGNPVYAWLSVAQLSWIDLQKALSDVVPPPVARYLVWCAHRIAELERSDLSPVEKKRRVATALGFAGKGSANPFGQFRRDRADMKAAHHADFLEFIHNNLYGKALKKTVYLGSRVATRNTVASRLRRGERLSEIWGKHVTRQRPK